MKYKQLLEMYSYYFLRWYSKGVTDDLNAQLANDTFLETYDKLISNGYVLKMYHVTEYPRQMQLSLTHLLRKTAPQGCYVDVYTSIDREIIDWSSPSMVKIRNAMSENLKKNPTHLDRRALNTAEDYSQQDKADNAVDSWNLVAKKTHLGHATARSETVMLCFYWRPITAKQLQAKEKILYSNAGEQGIKLNLIKGNVTDVLRTIAPTSIPQKQPVLQFSTLLDENVALFETYTSGKIGGKKIYLGRDIDLGMFVFEDILNTKGGALNILIVASTGSGKSFYIKFLVEVLLVARVNVIVWDKDGEYQWLSKLQGMQIINLGAEGGKYYNTVPISTIVEDGLTMSINDTLTIFEILADVDSGMTSVERFIFNLAYNHMLNSLGITREDRNTWSLSESLDYKNVYDAILAIEDEIAKEDVLVYKALCKKLFMFFDPKGMHSQIFKSPLNIDSILSKKKPGQPLMLCINMQTKSNPDKETTARLLDKIKSHTMSNVSSRMIDYNRSIDEYTALVVEEINRHMDNKNFITMVNEEVTGGRKRNLIPILVTNSINAMVNSDNRMLQDIVDNMDTIIVGALNSNASKLVQERYSLQHCSRILDQISEASKEGNSSKYKNTFLVRTKTELAVVKATVPEHLAKSNIFITRTVSEDVD